MLTQRDLKFFQVAKAVAALSTWSERSCEQVGAIVVLRNEVISTGFNRRKTSPQQARWAEKAGNPEAIWQHAEVSALTKLLHYGQKDLSLAKIYVYRETALGLGLAKPCDICTLGLKEVGITNVYYTTKEGYAFEQFI